MIKSKNINLFKNCKIVPILTNQTVKIYNGKKFYKFKITKKMVGYKIGEFVQTRTKQKK